MIPSIMLSSNKFKSIGTFAEKKLIFILLLISCILLYRPAFENDTYWLLNTGRYILNSGFPAFEPFTFHTGLSFSAQQWLAAVVFYMVYGFGGTVAVHLLNILLYFSVCCVIYLTCLRVSGGNGLVSSCAAMLTCIFLSFFMVPRPQVFSLLVFAMEIYLLESYIEYKNKGLLALLPLLSLLLVNLHAAIWLFFFVLYIPYIMDGLRLKAKGIHTQGYGVGAVTAAFAASFAVGFLNPYGTANMFYFLKVGANPLLNAAVNEMKSPDFKSPMGILVFLLLAAIVLAYIRCNGNTRLRYFLITAGTTYMALSSMRSIALLLVCAVPFTACCMKELRLSPSTGFSGRKKAVMVCTLLMLVSIALTFKTWDYSPYMSDFRPTGAVEYIKKNLDENKMRLYNSFESGGYLEFYGIRPFIDSRAEVFLKAINKKEDIIVDYLDMQRGRLYYRDFIQKYSLNYFLVSKGDLLETYLKVDPAYRQIYSDDKFILYGLR